MTEDHVDYLSEFQEDIGDVLRWSEKHFGVLAADRYESLIQQAIFDIMDDPRRPGTTTRPELAFGAFTYHLTYSRDHVANRVRSPRHLILFRYKDERLEFARLLHDSRDLVQYLPEGYAR